MHCQGLCTDFAGAHTRKAPWCSVLQCVAVCCSVLQRVAVCCIVFQNLPSSRGMLAALPRARCRICRCKRLQCIAVCCFAVCCCAVCCSVLLAMCFNVLQSLPSYRGILAALSRARCRICRCSWVQCVGVCRSVCCSALQCVAVCCVLQSVSRTVKSSVENLQVRIHVPESQFVF